MKCPNCNSENVRYRVARQNYICDDCDYVFVEDFNSPQRIFISYGHDEYTEFAYKLTDSLKDSGFEVFIDRDGIRKGEQWEVNLEDGLKWTIGGQGNGLFLLLMTPYSVRRPDGYCLNEIAYAIDINLKIIPVMLKQVTPPLSIYRLQYYNLPIESTENEQLIKGSIEKIINVIKGTEPLDISGNFKTLETSLEPIEFNSELKLFSKDFVGREWLFTAIQDWLPTRKQTLLITGMPGIGKSAISTFLYHRMPNVIGFYMFRRNDNEKLSPIKFISTLAFQIASQIPSYRESLLRLDIDKLKQNYNETALFSRLIENPLSSIVHEKEKVIIIDGLDEAEQEGQNQIAELISNCIPHIPKWIKLLILARPIPSVVIPFETAANIKLDAKSLNNMSDIKNYMKNVLPNISDNTLNTITERSEGSFLYVKYICENNMPESLNLLPLGLSSYYYNCFSSMFDSKNYEQTRMFLELILASPRPLSIKMLIATTGNTQYATRDFLEKMGAFLMQNNGMLKIYHSSLADWLTDEKKSGRFWVDSGHGSQVLSKYICSFIKDKLQFYHNNDDFADENGIWRIVRNTYQERFEEIKKKTDDVEEIIGMEIDNYLFILYIELLIKTNDWQSFVMFSKWYISLPSSFNMTRELISKTISTYYSDISKQPDYPELYEVFKTKFTKKVQNLMTIASNGDPYDLTHYMALLGYDIRDLVKPEFGKEWLEDLCEILMKSFPYPKVLILPSGYAHEDGICGCFADEICDILYKVMHSGKIKNPRTLEWMRHIAHEDKE